MSKALTLRKEPIKTIGELNSELEKLQQKANVLSPIQAMDQLPYMHTASLRLVKIDPDENAGEVYKDRQFCKDNERALSKVGILKIMRAAGAHIVSSERVDDRSDPLLVSWTVAVQISELDGNTSTHIGSKTVDLRPGSLQTKGWTDKRIDRAANFISDLAESKAMLRAARAALTLRQKYTVEELAKPFVFPVLVADVHEAAQADPEIRRMAAAKALGITAALYGAPGGTPDPVQVTTNGEVIETQPEPASPLAEGEVEPDLPPAPEPEPTGETYTNDCPCGDKTPMPKSHYEKSMRLIGCARVAGCWPHPQRFDFDRHANVSDLKIPSRPDLTVERLRGMG